MNWFSGCRTVAFTCLIRLKLEFLIFEPYLYPDSYGWNPSFWYLNRILFPILTVEIRVSGIWTVSFSRFLRLNLDFLICEPYPTTILTLEFEVSGIWTVLFSWFLRLEIVYLAIEPCRQFICCQNRLHKYELISGLFEKSRKPAFPG